MKVLVTGGAGFIGSNFVQLLHRERPDWEVVNLDKLTYAGNIANLEPARDWKGHTFVRGDIADAPLVGELFAKHRFDAVVNFAAESHVDRSIQSAEPFVRTNILGTLVLLEAARRLTTHDSRPASLAASLQPSSICRFVQVSTDEVYGSLGPDGSFNEETPLAPNSPYSASKASADMLCRAFAHTHGMDVVITRCSNNYGPYQFPEKLIPLMIANAIEDKPLPVYGDGMQVRDWIFVEDHCRALLAALENGKTGEVYNFGGRSEMTNLRLVEQLLDRLGKPRSLIRHVEDRPGHDRRYAMDIAKSSRELGWKPRVTFDEGLERTVEWYRANRSWWEAVRTGEYLKYYDEWYGDRLKEDTTIKI
ncbi:MAG: dTDP-glucose 4,6-dehydratase [Deltaproteobacteria bacterium]|nr:dTDP-glucose 4,6-dehydratase [Deltaproteobacteria bacterium]